jgi:CO dehydrogenase nickel-insertion accessory protein CooC1
LVGVVAGVILAVVVDFVGVAVGVDLLDLVRMGVVEGAGESCTCVVVVVVWSVE